MQVDLQPGGVSYGQELATCQFPDSKRTTSSGSNNHEHHFTLIPRIVNSRSSFLFSAVLRREKLWQKSRFGRNRKRGTSDEHEEGNLVQRRTNF